MIVGRSEQFKKSYKKLPRGIQERVDKTVLLLVTHPGYPSLHNKKMQGTKEIWEIRVTQNYRMTYEKITGGVFLRRVGTHDILIQP